MTNNDLRILSTALGFVAVVVLDVPYKDQAARAKAFARLIESFCFVTAPEAFESAQVVIKDDIGVDVIDLAIDRYKKELVEKETAELPDDRDSLVKMYDRLLLRKQRREQREFYLSGNDELLANRILQLTEEEIDDARGQS